MGNGDRYYKVLVCIFTVIICALIITWFVTRDTLPREIRIATAVPGGLYYKFGEVFKEAFEADTGRDVVLLKTNGSQENKRLLLDGSADLAFLQAGSISMDELSGIVPLWPDVIHMVIRKGRGIKMVNDLAGKNIVIGRKESGMWKSAEKILAHYDIPLESIGSKEGHFTDLKKNSKLDGAIVTTGLLNPDLKGLCQTGKFELIDILDCDAISTRHSYFSSYIIPRGFFCEGPPLPAKDIRTVAAMTFLASRRDMSDTVVLSALATLYSHDLRADDKVPTLIKRDEASKWEIFPMHESSKSYFTPYEGIDLVAKFMDSLAGAKELLFAMGAGLYVLWKRRTYRRQKRIELEIETQRKLLDKYLEETFVVERKQMAEESVRLLKEYLDEVTNTKLNALEELASCELRGDRRFHIFLVQCDNLSRKIQNKLIMYVKSDAEHIR